MYQHTVQHIALRGQASARTARKLIANAQGPAAITLTTTVECSAYADHIAVVPCRSKSVQIKCGVTLVPGQLYYMVRSTKFASRWYLLTKNGSTGAWMCSLRDVETRCVMQVEQFLAARNVDQGRG